MKVYCLACQKRCKGEVLRVQEQYMHKDCFKCHQCSASLHRGGFFVRDAKFYCPDDYQRLFGVKCRICADYVVGEVITALGSTFHPSCFRCQTCRQPFTPGDRVTLWSNELYLCKACSHGERLKEAEALRVSTAGVSGGDANTDTGYTTESTGNMRGSSGQQPPHHYHHCHYLPAGQHSPGSFSCPSEASFGTRSRSRFGGQGSGQLGRSYLTLEQEAERVLHPNDRYRRPGSPCASVATPRSPSPQPLHFHLPQDRDGRPRSRAHSLAAASSSRGGGGTHPGSIGPPRRPASVAGGYRPRTPRTPSPAPSLDPSEDPLLLSHYPGGSRPDLNRPAPIERDDWPCPPLPALLLAERLRQRKREEAAAAEAAEPQTPPSRPQSAAGGAFREGSRAQREFASGRLELGGLGSALLLGPEDPPPGSPPPPSEPSRASRRDRMQQRYRETPRPPPQPTAARRTPVPSPQDFVSLANRSYSPASVARLSKASSLPPPERRRPPLVADAATAAPSDASSARRQRRYAELLTASAASSDLDAEEDLFRYPNVLGLHSTMGLSRLRRPLPPPLREYPYELLRRHDPAGARRPPPRGADPTRLEAHLSDAEFTRVFRVDRRQFERFPEWRRNDLKRKADLF